VEVAVGALDAAVKRSCIAVPDVIDGEEGDTVTPAGRPEMVTGAVSPLANPESRRDACSPAVPAVNIRLEGVSERVGVEAAV
jgi:hypothetical protein